MFVVPVGIIAYGQRYVRVIQRSMTPIENLLQPDDEMLIVTSTADEVEPPHGPLSLINRLQFQVGSAQFVGIAQVTAVTSRLTPTGNWIETDVEATVLEAIRGPVFNDGSAALVRFRLDGGEMTIGSTHVRSEWAPQVAVGDVLLIVLPYARPSPYVSPGASAYTVTNNILASVDSRLDSVRRPTLFDGVDLGAVRKALPAARR
ncbi:MAG: hypothetical protein QM736_29590 [Vicinamibacterales bacterium]